MQVTSYYVYFKPKDHEAILVYTETDVDKAIRRALSIYDNFPILHQVNVFDNENNPILILYKNFKNI